MDNACNLSFQQLSGNVANVNAQKSMFDPYIDGQPLMRQSRRQQTTYINFFHCFSEKIRPDVSSESSARQRIHMKNQALFSLKDTSKILKCRLLQCLFGAFGVKHCLLFL